MSLVPKIMFHKKESVIGFILTALKDIKYFKVKVSEEQQATVRYTKSRPLLLLVKCRDFLVWLLFSFFI